jgi:rod shape determining protein RodA
VRLQPSELARVAMVLMLARYFQRHPPGDVRRLRDLFWPALIAGGTVGAIILQRDMGVALLTLMVASTYLLFVRIPLKSWAAVAGTALAVLAIVWIFVLAPYQKSRILDVADPARDPLASGYQANQSRIAIGSGGIFGKGYMNGSQAQLEFLPERSTDFIFAVIGEEWGLVGGMVLMALYLLVIGRGLYIATQAQDTFTRLIAGSLTLLFAVYAFVNSGMVAGLLPVVGVPLPLVSYGGTSLVTLMAGFGILMSIHSRRKLVST